MYLNKRIIETFKTGQIVWYVDMIGIPYKLTFVGIIDKYYVFTDGSKSIKLLVTHVDVNETIQRKQLATTYEDVCQTLKWYLLNQVDHYNKHQLKDNPIVLSDEDRHFLNTGIAG